MAEASSDQIAEEDRQNAGAGLLSAQTISGGDESTAGEDASTDSKASTQSAGIGDSIDDDSTSSSNSPEAEAAAAAPALIQRMLGRYRQFPGPARRLVIWAGVVLIVGFLMRAGSAVQPVFATPQERFEKFAQTVKERLPAILYGNDSLGGPLLPVEVNWEITSKDKSKGPLQATITFEDASFSKAGQLLYTHFKIDYQWQRDHWQCHNLKCDVERPELSKLDQMDFNAVVAHESAEKNLELVKLKRAQAEALLRPNLPLGELLRSANLY